MTESGETISPSGKWADRLLGLLIVSCILLAVAGLGLYYRYGGSIESHTAGGDLTTITIMAPGVTAALMCGIPVCLLALMAMGIIALDQKRALLGMLAMGSALLLLCAGVVLAIVTMFDSPWMLMGHCRGPAGKQYAYLEYSVLQAQVLALCEEQERTAFRRTYRVIGDTNGDSPRSWTTVIRPADCDSQLLLSPDGWLVGFRHDSACYFAYNPSTGVFLGHGDVERLSPLILMGKDTVPLSEDITAILSDGNTIPGTSGMSLEALRAEAARHPNPRIRQLLALTQPTSSSGTPTAPNSSK